MLAKWRVVPRTDKFLIVVICLFLVVLALTGGSSRASEPAQFAGNIAAAFALPVLAFGMSPRQWLQAGQTLLFVLAALALVLFQLVPLPAGLWTMAPGRFVFTEAMSAVGIEPGWHALSLTPDATISAALAFVPLLAALAFVARRPERNAVFMHRALLLVIAGGAFIAVLQVGTGAPYFYRVANFGEATGSFANRNHFALFTALSVPLLAVWATEWGGEKRNSPLIPIIAGMAALTVAALLLVTGSRGGLVVGLVGFVAGFLIWSTGSPGGGRKRLLVGVAAVLAGVVVVVAAFIAQSRDLAVSRLIGSSDHDARGEINRTMLPMILDYMPWGSGYGSFVPVYKVYEPLATLGPRYINQAHNDIFQILLEGGLFALLLLLAFVAWYVRQSWRVWCSSELREESGDRFGGRKLRGASDTSLQLARAASAMILMIGIMSAFDYPMRTSLVATAFVLAMFWLERGANVRMK